MNYTEILNNVLNSYNLTFEDLTNIKFRALADYLKQHNDDEGEAYLDWMLLASTKNELQQQNKQPYSKVIYAEDNPLNQTDLIITNPCRDALDPSKYINPFRWFDFDELSNFFTSLRQLDDLT